MSVGALVQQVGEVLGRGHSLFGEPGSSGGVAALDAGSGLVAARDSVRTGQRQMTGLSGALPATYTSFVTDAGPALDAAAGADDQLGGQLQDAAGADRSGRITSDSVVNGAATDTATLAPASGTPAGQRALITALRSRVAQQQQVVNTYKARDARLAAMVRSLAYARQASGGGMPMSATPLGGGGLGSGRGGGSPLSALSGLSGLAGASRHPPAALVSNVDRLPGEPGQGAAKAALSRLGRPYVWGAKGPSTFDCSGLTQWAWRQAGVALGNDTYAQINDGVPVPPGQVRAGDLIFPLDSFGKSGPGHVQLAISDHQVIHAPTTGDVVKIAPMPSRYVARRPVRSGGLTG